MTKPQFEIMAAKRASNMRTNRLKRQRLHSQAAYPEVLVIILDSMDRTKFAWPRWPFRKVPKSLEGIQRPRLVLTAAIAHGFATCLFVTQENVFHGADAFLEMLPGS